MPLLKIKKTLTINVKKPSKQQKIDSYLRALDSGKLDNYYKNKEIRRKYVQKSRQKAKQKNRQDS
jgi:hypothetical protein